MSGINYFFHRQAINATNQGNRIYSLLYFLEFITWIIVLIKETTIIMVWILLAIHTYPVLLQFVSLWIKKERHIGKHIVSQAFYYN